MNVLSLFDGMSCGQQALERANINVENYFASEIDKYAIQVTMANYPNTKQLGSVTLVDGYKLPKIDLVIGGSPCQSFSFAGKRKGMATKCETEILTLEHYLQLKSEGYEFEGQSYLFWEFMRLLNEVKPTYFLLENVMMGEKWENILSKAIGVNAIEINSSLVSAQNRRRLYWTNIGLEPGGLFGDLESTIKQPKDKGMLLKNILENEVDEKYFLSHKATEGILQHKKEQKEKGFGFGAVIKNENEKMNALKVGGSGVDDLVLDNKYLKIDKKGNIKGNQDKASCFTAGGHSGGNHSDMDLIVHNTMPRSSTTGKGGTGHLSRADGKTYCLDTGNTNAVEIIGTIKHKYNGDVVKNTSGKVGTITQHMSRSGMTNGFKVVVPTNEVELRKVKQISTNNKSNGGTQPYQQDRIYDIDGISPALQSQLCTGSTMINTSRIRRLTPMECERLQTVKDNYTNHVSDSQRYKMLGNGWTVDVIAHIFKHINK